MVAIYLRFVAQKALVLADKYFTVRLRVNQFEFSKFQQGQELGISNKAIIQEFCNQCSEIEITVFDKKQRKSITLPKGFLCKKVKNENGK